MRILLIEDDCMVRKSLAETLDKEGHHVVCGEDGQTAVRFASKERFDVMILDRLLPKLDGLGVIAKLKAAHALPSTIIISALNTPFNRAEGLKAGASDYIGKPFSMQEFLARIHVLERQQRANGEATHLTYSDIHLDLLNMEMRRGDKTTRLKQLEFRLLRFFMRQPETLISRENLHLGVWGYAFDPATNIVEVQISRLRKKLNMPDCAKLLHTVRGKGYVLGEGKPVRADKCTARAPAHSPQLGLICSSPSDQQASPLEPRTAAAASAGQK